MARAQKDPDVPRVVGAHRTASAAFLLAGAFVGWAAVWAVIRLTSDVGTWWGPLHVFLAGGVLLAISGATQLFSITWAAARPPVGHLAALQRWSSAVGVTLAVVGFTTGVKWLVVMGATLVCLGLILLGWLLVSITRTSLLRRFGLPGRFYLLAVGSGVLGVVLGGILGTGATWLSFGPARTAHMHLNLVGLVGFTIFGTLPTLLPTTAHHKMVSGQEARLAFFMCATASTTMFLGVWLGPETVGVGVGLAAIAGALLLGGIVFRLGPRRILQTGVPGILITCGTTWILIWLTHQAIVLTQGRHTIFAGATLIGVGGVALVLFGSLSYLIPVLLCRGPALGRGFQIMNGLAPVRIVWANAPLIAGLLGTAPAIVVGLGTAWLVEFASRVIRVSVHGRVRARATAS